MTVSAIPDLPEFTKADGIVYKLFGGEEALAIRRLADEMTLRHNEHHPVIRYAMAETAILSMISYEPGTHGELMHAARLVSLSMLQSDLAHEAAQPTATIEQKVRLASEVMRLERTICQSEKHFTQRQAARKSNQPPRLPAATPSQVRDGGPPAAVTRPAHAEMPRTPAAASASAASPSPATSPTPAAATAPAAASTPVAAPAPTAVRPPSQAQAPGSAPRPPSAGPPRSVAVHPPAPLPGPPGPHTAAPSPQAANRFPGLDRDDPPDGGSALLWDGLERAMAHRMAAEGATPPPPPTHAPAYGLSEAPRP